MIEISTEEIEKQIKLIIMCKTSEQILFYVASHGLPIKQLKIHKRGKPKFKLRIWILLGHKSRSLMQCNSIINVKTFS